MQFFLTRLEHKNPRHKSSTRLSGQQDYSIYTLSCLGENSNIIIYTLVIPFTPLSHWGEDRKAWKHKPRDSEPASSPVPSNYWMFLEVEPQSPNISHCGHYTFLICPFSVIVLNVTLYSALWPFCLCTTLVLNVWYDFAFLEPDSLFMKQTF